MMTIKQIYELGIKLGTVNDLRGEAAVKRKLERERRRYEALPAEDKKNYDRENLVNPFSDMRYFTKDPNGPVRRILVGIDIGVGEVLLAKELTDTGRQIDLVLSHHPFGSALAALHEVMHLQAEVMALYGVPINVGESMIQLRMSEVSRLIDPENHSRVIDAAQLLGYPVMCVHTPSDNMVATFLKRLLERKQKQVELVGDIMKLFRDIPEYQIAARQKAGPVLYAGDVSRFTGRIALTEVTGGTSGSKEMYEKLSQAGIGTIIGMHMHEEHKKEAEKHHINVIIAGHMSSDSLGMNLFLDELEKRGVEIVPCSGLIRISRLPRRKKQAAPIVKKQKRKK